MLVKSKTWKLSNSSRRRRPYQDSGVSCSEGKDVGAGHGARTFLLQCSLDLVDDLEPPRGVPVGVRPLLARYRPATVQQKRRVTALTNRAAAAVALRHS